MTEENVQTSTPSKGLDVLNDISDDVEEIRQMLGGGSEGGGTTVKFVDFEEAVTTDPGSGALSEYRLTNAKDVFDMLEAVAEDQASLVGYKVYCLVPTGTYTKLKLPCEIQFLYMSTALIDVLINMGTVNPTNPYLGTTDISYNPNNTAYTIRYGGQTVATGLTRESLDALVDGTGTLVYVPASN